MNLTKRPVILWNFWFRIFFASWRPQNSNSGGHKTSIFIDNIPFTLNPWIRLIDTNTNKKKTTNMSQCSVSIQKRYLKLVLCPPEWKKASSFSDFAHNCF